MERFGSKRDGWLIGVLVIALGVALISLGAGLAQPGHPVGLWGVFGILLASTGFVVWLWTTTDYLLGEEELLVRSGPFRWRIPVAEIREITPTHNPCSSPALSLDRLEIRYGRGGFLLISPKDRARFFRSLALMAPHLEVRGDHATTRRF